MTVLSLLKEYAAEFGHFLSVFLGWGSPSGCGGLVGRLGSGKPDAGRGMPRLCRTSLRHHTSNQPLVNTLLMSL